MLHGRFRPAVRNPGWGARIGLAGDRVHKMVGLPTAERLSVGLEYVFEPLRCESGEV